MAAPAQNPDDDDKFELYWCAHEETWSPTADCYWCKLEKLQQSVESLSLALQSLFILHFCILTVSRASEHLD